MASRTAVLLIGAALGGCAYHPGPAPEAGNAPVNVPVVSRADYAFDAAAPGGELPASEANRLDAWFRSLDLRYGDEVYIDSSPYSGGAKAQAANVAGRYGLFISPGAPVTQGSVAPGTLRIVVSRKIATVPNCPNWERPSQPNYNNKMMPNLGCGVNSNLAMMIANPDDLIHGREGSGTVDAVVAARAVDSYRKQTPTGEGGLKDISTKGK